MDRLTVADVRAWARRSAELLAAARAQLDAANRFPVPDHDTGTNLSLTARAAAGHLEAADPPAETATALRRLATGAVRAARGNSGAILSQVLRGFADAAAAADHPVDAGEDLAAAFRAADHAARAAVADPVEGTMLTVTRAAAEAAGPGEPAAVALAAVAAARERVRALGDPTGGGVDAGAEGLLLVYGALAEVLGGEAVADPAQPPALDPGPAEEPAHVGTPGGPAYEVQYLLDLPPGAEPSAAVPRLAEVLGTLGDSLVLADDGAGLWAVHVHVDDVGAAVEAGAALVAHGGAMSRVRVTRFAEAEGKTQTEAGAAPALPRAVAGTPVAPVGAPDRAAVVVTSAADHGVARALFAGLEVVVLGPGEQFPPGELVVVAVGEAATAAAMRHADRVPGVTVVPARAVVQAMAAVAVHDPSRRAVDDTVAMAEAAAGCRHAALATAESAGLTIVGLAAAGDVLGLVGDEVAVIGAEEGEVGRRLLDRLLAPGGELVTVLHRTDSAALAAELAAHVRALGDHLDVEVHEVGAELASPVLLGVE